MVPTVFSSEEILEEYQRIMEQEAVLAKKAWHIPDGREIFYTAYQIKEIAQNGLILRGYHDRYGLTSDKQAYESVSAHTNLLGAVVDRALSFLYGSYYDQLTIDGHTHREISEAIRRHDLAENKTGDIIDNGDRDEEKKLAYERIRLRFIASLSPPRESDFDASVNRLLGEMESKSSPIGRLLYVSDKACAILMTLCYDDNGTPPVMKLRERRASNRDKEEMSLCDQTEATTTNKIIRGVCHASEMWSIDYFKMRNLVSYDDIGYITALIVITTLWVHNHWYEWREADYQKADQE
ncbi:HD domain-containing protein [Candidatus Saccharibacteria bacterium]|nr:HD domain-containing protein [Candidatus Saccharibacteria bacterium]